MVAFRVDRVASPVYVGRDEALETLAATMRTAIRNGPAVALVAGEAGIGKTRLLTEFTRSLNERNERNERIEPGLLNEPVRVVEGACTEFASSGGEGFAYAPFVAVLRRLAKDGAATASAREYRELTRWFPELGEPSAPDAGERRPRTDIGRPHPHTDPGGPHPHTDTGKHRLYEEVLALIEEAAVRRPLMVIVEDLHWADAASRELFAFLARNLTQPGILLVTTYRPDATRINHLDPLLTELVRGPRTTTLRLPRLGRNDVGRQLAAILGAVPDGPTLDHVYRRSDGNPLFVEALAHAEEGTPDSLRELLLQAPRALPAPARRLLGLASAGGSRIAHRLLEELADESGDGLDALIRVLVDHGLLVPDGDGYTFRHALIRHAVYEDLLPGERARLHARYVEALSTGDAYAELAAHAAAAGDHASALVAAYRAAGQARRSYAYQDQVQMLERVIDWWDRTPGAGARAGVDLGGVRTEAAEACMFSGDYERGVEHATAGLALLDEHRAPERVALLLEHRGRLLHRLNSIGTPDFERALRLLPDDPDDTQRGRVLGVLAMGLLPGSATGQRAFDEALRVGRRTGDATVTVRGLLGRGARHRDLDALVEASALAERLEGYDLLLTVPMYEATLHTRDGEHRRAIDTALAAARRARRFGLGLSRGAALTSYAVRALILTGEWERATALLDEALTQSPPPVQDQVLRSMAGQLALMRGDLRAAEAALVETEDAPHDVSMYHQYRWRPLLALAQGDPERADRLLGRALADPGLAELHGVDSLPVLITGALVQRARGDAHGPAVTARRAELAAMGRVFGVGDDGAYDKALRMCLHALLDDTGWDEVIAAWRELGQPYELAQSLLYGGQAALLGGDRDGGRTLLDEAAKLAATLGAAPLTREIALAAGPAPGTGGLTPRQHDVLALIAEGLSNRRIAERLHISPSTAGVHVSHILAKLGATTRTEAAAIAHRNGLAR
ncbi:helix-turn-helix transcriptional regulator [Streptomyces alfalfae]|uniref:AAA family ATPase n=1 Tax=Streptomyces alfalfae TaxID=1642299 RepID=A0A7T4PBY6_9ACTN|nr:helix-turn-helix transcriptional regulator [Streptomyces alfalfae]QQC87421.1 AAA family ATPase [Streptomyces alfalfae]